ncbi:FxLYD domain-containing protein [Desulfovibrio mangrovi]|uniref:FxLYD domain-containing protein n=1 Tax=Desulfovibrio mangrovi TaxID=2976983 RepID=UPI00224720E6|nr:FxLYD domain-containing protein [Desulfovibrio mangrovi]UZP68472.1 FxLYD domain-containing protein [Desulfovibrio mangrovi]
MIVIEGEVRNMTGNALSYIGVSAVFYDSSGDVIGSERQLCGNILPADELRKLSAVGIQSRLRITPHLHGTHIPVKSDETVPFMIVFSGNERPHEFSVSAYVLDLGADR